MTRTLFGKILVMSLVIILIVSVVSGVLANFFIKKYILYNKQQAMIRQGERVVRNIIHKSQIAGELGLGKRGMWFIPIRGLMRELEEVLGARIWPMDKEGRIYLDVTPVRQLTDQELKKLWDGKILAKYNWNDELNQPILAVAIPLEVEQHALGGLLIVTPMKEIYEVQAGVRRIIVLSAWIGGIVAVILAFLFSRRLTRPILAMKKLITRMRQGDFTGQVETSSGDELGDLGRHFNELNSELDETIGLLQTEKEQTRRIINSMAEGVISLSEAGQVLVINPTARRLLNLIDENVSSGDVFLKLSGLKAQVDKVIKEQKPLMREIEHAGMILASIVSPILTGETQLLGVVIVLQDITNRWRLVQLQKELIANVSHEFKTPLTSIKGFVELMLDDKIKDEKGKNNSLEIIYQETIRLIKMVEGLLKMARIEANRLHLESVDMCELVRKVVGGLSLKIQETGVKMITDISLQQKPFLDPDRMEQVFFNLLDNAIRFSPRGGEIQIYAREIFSGQDDTILEIQVRDQGPGIPIKERELIFDRFYKIEKARSANDSGTGLGLSIVKSIIEEHGGKIWATDHQEGGALFTIHLPMN